MNDINYNVDKFLKYMARPLPLPSIELVYSSNNVAFERVDMYRDFILTFTDLILTTYMGDDITDAEDQFKHFNWCWNKASDIMSYSSITFRENEDGFTYFSSFFFDNFYTLDKEVEDLRISSIGNIWRFIFDYNVEKSRSELDNFITLYKVFEKTYKKA